jgi:hypothetical protein
MEWVGLCSEEISGLRLTLPGLLLAMKALLREIAPVDDRVAVFGRNCIVAAIRFRPLP